MILFLFGYQTKKQSSESGLNLKAISQKFSALQCIVVSRHRIVRLANINCVEIEALTIRPELGF